jgi:hypothetical protein
MCEEDQKTMKVLAQLSKNGAVRSTYFYKQLDLPRNKENNFKVRRSLGRLKRQKFVEDAKDDFFSGCKYWRLTDLGWNKARELFTDLFTKR